MRLDKFLQATGILKRRTEAKEACEEGRVLVNEQVARPAKEVQPGQVIGIEMYYRRMRLEILQVPTGNVSKAARTDFIRIIEEESTRD